MVEYIKRCLRSRTVWAGLAQIVACLGLYFTGEQTLQELLLGASGLVMIIFRMITKEPLGAK